MCRVENWDSVTVSRLSCGRLEFASRRRPAINVCLFINCNRNLSQTITKCFRGQTSRLKVQGSFIYRSRTQCSASTCNTHNENCSLGCSGGWNEPSHSLRQEAALWSGGTAADTSVSLARWQQGEQTVAGMGAVFQYRLGSEQTTQLTNVASLDRWVPATFWAVLITRCRDFLSRAVLLCNDVCKM